jgi:hypothetical protein
MKRIMVILVILMVAITGTGVKLLINNRKLQASGDRLQKQLWEQQIENERIRQNFIPGLSIVPLVCEGVVGDTLTIATIPYIRHMSDRGNSLETALPQEIWAEMDLGKSDFMQIKYGTDSIGYAKDSLGFIPIQVSARVTSFNDETVTIDRKIYIHHYGDSVSLMVDPDE